MAQGNSNLALELRITATDAASPEIQRLTGALSELGVETRVIADGMAESERKAIGAFGAIADSARSTGDMIERGLVAALSRIESPQGVTELQNELARLRDSGRLSAEELERLQEAQERLDRLTYASSQSQAALTQELQRQRNASAEAARDADNLGEATGRASAKFVDHRQKTGDLSEATDALAEKFGISGDAFELLTGKLAGAAAIGALAAAFVNANREADRLASQFQAMTGDAGAAQQEIAFLTDVANRWGVAVNDLAPAYLRLAAATKGSTAEGEATRKMIDDLTAAYMNAGAGVDELEEVMEILGETFADGRVSVDDLKEGMQEDMPPAIQAATTAILDNNAALQAMLSSGDAATEDFMPAFAAALREHIGGSQTQVDSVSAAFTRLIERVNALFVSVDNQTGAMTGFDAVVKGVIKTLETGVAAVEVLSSGFAFVGEAAGAAAGALATGESAIDAVGAVAETTGERIGKSILSLWGLKTASEEAALRQQQMQKELQALREETDPYGAALERLNKKLQEARDEFQKTGDVVKLTEAALTEFFAAPEKNLNVDGVLKLAAALKTVGTDAEASSRQISDTLGQQLSKLTNEQLAELERQARSALAAASQGSETSRVAFAELGQVVEGVVLARLQRLGVDGPEALYGISKAADDAIDDFMALASYGDSSAGMIEDAFDGALKRLDNRQELETFQANIEELGEAGLLSGEQVGQMLLRIQQRLREVSADPAWQAIEREFSRNIEFSKNQADAIEGLVDAQNAGLRAEIALAEAKGHTAEVQRLTRQLAIQEAEGALRVAEAKWAEQQAEAALAIKKLEQLNATKDKNAETQKQIDLAVLVAQKELAEAEAAGVNTEVQRTKLEKLQQISAAAGNSAAATEQQTKATEQNTEANRYQNEALHQQGTILESNAERVQRLEKAEQEANKQREKDLKSQGEFVSGIINGWNDRLGALSEASEQAFRNATQGGQAAAEAAEKATDATELLRAAQEGLAAGGLVSWANRMAQAALEIELSFKGQAESADRLAASLETVGAATGTSVEATEALIRQAEAAQTSFNLLDQERLDHLNAAIDSAKQKLREMQEETQSARERLAEMNAELLEAQGQDEKAALLRQQLDYQQQLAEIERQRTEAELTGNRELLDVLNQQQETLEKINRAKTKSIQAEAASPSASPASSAPAAAAPGRGVYTLNLTAGQQRLTATTTTDPGAFLSALETAQLRSL